MSKSARHPAIKQIRSSGHKTVEIAKGRKSGGETYAAAMAHEHDGNVPAAESQKVDNVTKLPTKGRKAAPSESAVTFKPGQVQEVPFRDLNIAPGYNFRTFDPAKPEHRALAESIRLYGVHTPLTVWLEDSKPFIAAGHLRYGACDWLSRDGGGKKSIVPSVPVIYNPWLDNPRNRLADLAISNSAIATTPMEKAEVAARMTADKYTPAAIGAVLGNIGTKWVSELVKLHELRGTALADMVQLDRVSSTTALDLLKAHGKESAVSIARAVWAELTADAKYGATPKITTGRVNAYLAKLAKQTPTPPATTGKKGGETPTREPVDEAAKAAAEVAAAKAELELAEARRKAARGNSVPKANRELEKAKATLATAMARVTELTESDESDDSAPKTAGKKRGATARTGENAEKDKDAPEESESTTFRSYGSFITVGKDGFRLATIAAMANDPDRNAARVAWVVKALNRLDAREPFPG